MNPIGDSSTGTSAAASVAGSGRMTLLLIAGIPVIVILASTWMWYYVASGKLDIVGALGTANKGELVEPPRQVVASAWTGSAGESLDVARRRPARWTIVVPQVSAVCDQHCEARLYETRQIHMALGKEMGRVQRMLLTPASAPLQLAVAALSDDRPLPDNFSTYLARDQRGLDVWRGDAAAFTALFPELAQKPDSWYLMDPGGWIMMRYDPSIDYKDVISDLKFLIRNSNG